MRPMWQGH